MRRRSRTAPFYIDWRIRSDFFGGDPATGVWSGQVASRVVDHVGGEVDADHRRVYRLEITAEGRRLHRDAAGVLHKRYERWASAMTQDEREGLAVGLPALLRVLHADRPVD